jgi:SAM-dependent methyltransferase
MLIAARRRLPPDAWLAAGDAERLPFAARSFDVVVSSSSLHFWTNPDAGLRECRRVLHPGGHLVVTDWCDDFVVCRICDRLLRLRYGDRHRVLGTHDCRQLLEDAGFEVVRLDRYKISWVWGMMTTVARAATLRSVASR